MRSRKQSANRKATRARTLEEHEPLARVAAAPDIVAGQRAVVARDVVRGVEPPQVH